MSANNHRSHLIKAEDYDKPWKVKRLIGKYIKCPVCSGRAMYRERKMKWNAKRRREYKQIHLFME